MDWRILAFRECIRIGTHTQSEVSGQDSWWTWTPPWCSSCQSKPSQCLPFLNWWTGGMKKSTSKVWFAHTSHFANYSTASHALSPFSWTSCNSLCPTGIFGAFVSLRTFVRLSAFGLWRVAHFLKVDHHLTPLLAQDLLYLSWEGLAIQLDRKKDKSRWRGNQKQLLSQGRYGGKTHPLEDCPSIDASNCWISCNPMIAQSR